MNTKFKRFKYKTLVPLLLQLVSWFSILGGKADQSRVLSEEHFFILGSGRNGSTLLALLLNRHPSAFLPPEQYALPYSIIARGLAFTQSWTRYVKLWIKEYRWKNQDWVLLPEDYKSVEQELFTIQKVEHSAGRVFNMLLKKHASVAGKRPKLFGDHSPIVTLFYKEVYSEFPSAKFIFLVRHPLDVICSYQKLKDNPASNPKYASWKWNNSVEAYEWLRDKGASILLVKYEDLVTNPDITTKKILSFLKLKAQNLINDFEEKDADVLGAKGYDYHQNLYKPVSPSAIGKWKNELDIEVVNSVIPMLASNAAKMDYSLKNVES